TAPMRGFVGGASGHGRGSVLAVSGHSPRPFASRQQSSGASAATKTRGGSMKAKALASQRRFAVSSRAGSAFIGGGLAVLFAAGGGGMMGCAQQDGGEVTAVTSQALVATISGTISDTAGRPLNGVFVQMAGRLMASQTTGNAGTYSFGINIPDATASFSIQPARNGCTFNPTVVNLQNINGSRVANFTGSGAGCVGVAQTPTINATDPGPRPGPAGAGSALAGLTLQEQALFDGSQEAFEEVDSVSGDGVVDANGKAEDGKGLGPGFNGNSCAMCHAEPAVGGTSPGMNSRIHPVPNPQIALATLRGATNPVPFFVTANGPAREVRFPIALGGGVADIFTIRGRDDAPGCALAPPVFSPSNTDQIFRIATPTFGLGLMENTPDLTLSANVAANQPGAPTKAALGISGRLNTSGNDGTVTKFGWKAQNKSLVIFAGEAYNVEQGVSNEVFTNERNAVAGCVFNGSPEDHTNNGGVDEGTPAEVSSDSVLFAAFMRLLAPPTPAAPTASTTNGQAVFNAVGCSQCHTPSLTTGPSPTAALNNVTYNAFTDIAVHNMGALADGVPQ